MTTSTEELRVSQLWKLNEIASKKEGVRRSIYTINRKKSNVEDDDIQSVSNQEWEIGKAYTGEWSNDLRHGYGVQVWSNSSKYEGEWTCNQRNGFGVYWIPISVNSKPSNSDNNDNENDITSIYSKTASELSAYKSKNVRNLLQIRNEIYSHNQLRIKAATTTTFKLHKQYEGEWQNDVKHGKGTFYYQNGDKFEGVFVNNLRSGNGVMHYNNGDKYEGDWKFDKKNGFGICIKKKEKNMYIGYWMNDKKEGPGYYRFDDAANSKLYIAEWTNDAPNCGYFVNANDVRIDGIDDIDDLKLQKRLIPELGLIESNNIIKLEIETIRNNRKLVRHLTLIDDIEDLFENENEHENQLKNKIIDIFEQMTMSNTIGCTEQCYINKEDLYESIQDFELPSPFGASQQNEARKLNLYIAKYCNDLGIQKSNKSKGKNVLFIMTLLDFAKIVYLLLNVSG